MGKILKDAAVKENKRKKKKNHKRCCRKATVLIFVALVIAVVVTYFVMASTLVKKATTGTSLRLNRLTYVFDSEAASPTGKYELEVTVEGKEEVSFEGTRAELRLASGEVLANISIGTLAFKPDTYVLTYQGNINTKVGSSKANKLSEVLAGSGSTVTLHFTDAELKVWGFLPVYKSPVAILNGFGPDAGLVPPFY